MLFRTRFLNFLARYFIFPVYLGKVSQTRKATRERGHLRGPIRRKASTIKLVDILHELLLLGLGQFLVRARFLNVLARHFHLRLGLENESGVLLFAFLFVLLVLFVVSLLIAFARA